MLLRLNNPKVESSKKIKIFLMVISAIMLIAVFQDFFESVRSNYSFYISESFLFNTFWCWFFPCTLLYGFLHKKAHDNILQNIVFLFLIGIIHVLLYSVFVVCISFLFYENTYSTSKMISYTLGNDLYKYILGYSVIYMFYFRKNGDNEISEPQHISALKKEIFDSITIKNNRKNEIIRVEDIVCIVSESPYIAIHTKDKKYLHKQTLKSVMQQLDGFSFIRVHKTTILNTFFVCSYKSRLNGDYDILLKTGKEIRLSRNYLNDFKKVFQG